MLAVFALLTAATHANTAQVLISPDGGVRAIVRTDKKGSSQIEIRRGAAVLLQANLDEHVVNHAAWTADSQFLVMGTTATDGHQPWARPIWVYSRGRNRVFDLGHMGAVAVSDFSVKEIDKISVKVLNCAHNENGTGSRVLMIDLAKLMSAEQIADAPCLASS